MKLSIVLLVALCAIFVSADNTKFNLNQIDEKGLLTFLNDAFHVVYDPIDNLAISLSGMFVHLFAGIAAEGLPAPSGRSVVEVNPENQKLFDSLYALVYPVINPLVQSVSLSIAQTLLTVTNEGLAGLLPWSSKGLFSFINDAFHVVYDPIDNLAISLSGMFVHLFAGIAAEGLPAPSGRSVFQLRDVENQKLFDSLYALVYPVINPLVQSVSLSIAQTLLTVTNEGLAGLLPWSSKGLFSFLNDAFHVVYDPIDNLAISLSGMFVHLFAGIAAEGLPAPSGRSIVQLRSAENQKLFDSLYALVYPVINPLVQSVSLSIAQTLLTVTNEGLAGLLPW